MIKLTDCLFVAASEIAEVSINESAGTITCRMKSGVGHHVPNDYGKSVYATLDRLVRMIDIEMLP